MASSTGRVGLLLLITNGARWSYRSAVVDEGIKLVLTQSFRAVDWVFFHRRILKGIGMKIGHGYARKRIGSGVDIAEKMARAIGVSRPIPGVWVCRPEVESRHGTLERGA